VQTSGIIVHRQHRLLRALSLSLSLSLRRIRAFRYPRGITSNKSNAIND
jgi:hypothetical protein